MGFVGLRVNGAINSYRRIFNLLSYEDALKKLVIHEREIRKIQKRISQPQMQVNSCLVQLDLQIELFSLLVKFPLSPVEMLKKLSRKPSRPDLHKILRLLVDDGYLAKTLPLSRNYVKYFLTEKGRVIAQCLCESDSLMLGELLCCKVTDDKGEN